MAEPPIDTDAMFPLLDAAQMERLASLATPRRAREGEILFDQGDENHGVFIVVNGSIEILGLSSRNETTLRVLWPRSLHWRGQPALGQA